MIFSRAAPNNRGARIYKLLIWGHPLPGLSRLDISTIIIMGLLLIHGLDPNFTAFKHGTPFRFSGIFESIPSCPLMTAPRTSRETRLRFSDSYRFHHWLF